MAGSQLETTKQAVEDAENGCADAVLMLEQAQNIAENETTFAGQMGVMAHYSVLQQVVDALGEAYQQCKAAHSDAGGAKNALQQLTDQSGRDDLVKEAGAAATQLANVSAAIETAKGKIDNDALNFANESEVENVMHAVHTAASTVSESFTKVETATKAVESYKQQLQQSPGN